MKKLYLLLLFTTSINLFAQIDTTRKEFYPLQAGNLWQYRNEYNQLLTTKIRADTLIDNEMYYLYGNVALKTQGGIACRVDSFMRVQIRWGGAIGGDSCGGNTAYESSIYHLTEPDSTVWKICDYFNGMLTFSPLVRFNKINILNIFGQPREVMQFDFGGQLIDEKDTTWNYGASLVKGIGVIEERYFEGEHRVLLGAIINGIQYGNIVSVEESPETIPKEISLYQNYPNPFNPTTRIRYEIPKTTTVKLKVINILGEDVTTLVDEIKYPGSYEAVFNATKLGSGVYIAILQTPEVQLTRCMLLVK